MGVTRSSRGLWRAPGGANAFRRNVRVAQASGASREHLAAQMKAEFDRMDQLGVAEGDGDGAPSSKVYEDALLALAPRFPPSYVAMLKAHLAAPDHLISAAKLAEAAEYAGYEGATLNYGKLGQRVAEEIRSAPPLRANGTEIWTCAIARDPRLEAGYPDTFLLDALVRNMDTPHFEWQMRPQVVQALRGLGW
jgi:hypothetical protein